MPSRTSSESLKDSGYGLPLPRSNSHHEQLTARKTEVKINVYDLLPPGKLSTILWTIGSGLLHSGVVIGDREYAYGGHDRRGLTGAYYTKYASRMTMVFELSTDDDLQTKATTARRHVQNRNPTRLHPTQPHRARRSDTRSLRRLPGHRVQPPHKELQPLHRIPMREAHRQTCTQMAQPSSGYRRSLAVRCA